MATRARILGWIWALLAAAFAAALLTPAAVTPSPQPSALPQFDTGSTWFGSSFEEVERDYNAEEDPGSLFNVARRIGWREGHPTGEGVDVAIIDTGVVPVAALAAGNVVRGPDFSFEDANDSLRTLDTNGHGTHLSGIIAGNAPGDEGDSEEDRDDATFRGLAPDARLLSIKVGSADGSVDVSQVIAAINWVVDNRTANGWNIRVLNLAYGTTSTQPYEIDPLAYAVERAWHAGIVVVVAGGNDGSGAPLRSPATDPYVIAVGAGERTGKKVKIAPFSNQGTAERRLDILAPGESIVSLRNPGSYSDAYNEAGRVEATLVRGTGTSQASAVVSAAVAMLLEDRPQLTPDEVKAILIKSARGGEPGFIDIRKALRTSAKKFTQTWPVATGTGSIDSARGTSLATDPRGEALGEADVFGNSWAESGWAQDAWTGNRWLGSAWAEDVWQGTVWYEELWAGGAWSDGSWTGNEWSGNEWSGNEWSGNEWSTGGWSEAR